MSTYTDLHNRVKENIVVGYNDRITTQKVKFLNEENEYQGTFEGTLRAKNIDIAGGTLSNIHIVNAVLSNVSWEGGVNFETYGRELDQIRSNVNEITRNDIPALDDRIDNLIGDLNIEKITRETADSNLENKILNSAHAIDVALNSLSNELTSQDRDISVDLSEYISTSINDLSNASKELDLSILSEIESVSSFLSAESDRKYDILTEKTKNLSDEVVDLKSNFASEVAWRIANDEALCIYIGNVSSTSELSDLEILNKLADHAEDNKQTISELSTTVDNRIEHDKHYVIFDDTIQSYPFKTKDFAINHYKLTLPDAKVYGYNDETKRIEVGSLNVKNPDTPAVIFTTFEGIKDSKISQTVNEAHQYIFPTNGSNTIPTGANGYSITFDTNAYINNNQLSDCTFVLNPTTEEYHKVSESGEILHGIKIINAKLDGEKILSGQLYLDFSDPLETRLTVFNKFNKAEFNSTDLQVLEKDTERITFRSEENKLILKKYIERLDFINLQTEENTQFGKIYKLNGGISGVVSSTDEETNTTTIDEINVLFNNNRVNLTKTENFTKVLSTDVECPEGVYADYILSANVDQTSADFTFVKQTELYEYNIKGIELPSIGRIIPKLYNKTLNESLSFPKLSVEFTQDVIWIDEFKNDENIYVLKYNPASQNWVDTKSNPDKKISLTITFDCQSVVIKVVDESNVVSLQYTVDKDSFKIANSDSCHTKVHTHKYDLTKFNDSIEEPGAVFNLLIDPNITINNQNNQYILHIDVENTDIVKLEVPNKSSNDILREFIGTFNIATATDKFIKVELVDENSLPVSIYNLDNGKRDLFVKSNTITYLKFIEDRDQNGILFTVKDLTDAGDSYFIKKLEQDLNNEIETRELSVTSLQEQINTHTDDIAEIYNRIKGGINYKGVVVCEKSPINNQTAIHNVQTVSNLFYWNDFAPVVNSEYERDTVLSNGYMYYVGKLNNSNNIKFTVEGLELEVGDYIVINCKDETINGKQIQNLTSADIDIIDAVLEEDIDYLSSEICDLSQSLSNTIDENYVHLSGGNSISGDNEFVNGINKFEDISAKNVEVELLSAIDSTLDNISAINISANVLSCPRIYAGSVETEFLSSIRFAEIDTLSTRIEEAFCIDANIINIKEWIALSANSELVIPHLSNIVIDNDLTNENNITSSLNDILNLSVNELNSKIDNLDTSLTGSVEGLNDKIDDLSQSLSDTVNTEYFHLSGNNNISGDNVFVGSISVDNLSAENSTLTTSHILSGHINKLSVDSLSDILVLDKVVLHTGPNHDPQVSYISSVQDVLTLSSEILETKISELEASLTTNINEKNNNLCSEISGLSNDIFADKHISDREFKSATLSQDIQLQYVELGKTTTTTVNQLILVDEVTFERYCLTIRNGALAINKIDSILT